MSSNSGLECDVSCEKLQTKFSAPPLGLPAVRLSEKIYGYCVNVDFLLTVDNLD